MEDEELSAWLEKSTYQRIGEPCRAWIDACESLDDALRDAGHEAAADVVFRVTGLLFEEVLALAMPESYTAVMRQRDA